MDKNLFERDPRSYAFQLVEDGLVLLKYMSHDDVREALDANGLSPRFNEDADEEGD